MFISTNAIFLEDNYIMNHKPKGRIDLREVGGEPSDPPAVENNVGQKNSTSYPFLHRYLIVMGGLSRNLIDLCS